MKGVQWRPASADQFVARIPGPQRWREGRRSQSSDTQFCLSCIFFSKSMRPWLLSSGRSLLDYGLCEEGGAA